MLERGRGLHGYRARHGCATCTAPRHAVRDARPDHGADRAELASWSRCLTIETIFSIPGLGCSARGPLHPLLPVPSWDLPFSRCRDLRQPGANCCTAGSTHGSGMSSATTMTCRVSCRGSVARRYRRTGLVRRHKSGAVGSACSRSSSFSALRRRSPDASGLQAPQTTVGVRAAVQRVRARHRPDRSVRVPPYDHGPGFRPVRLLPP